MLHIYAVYLLAQFREPAAYPLLVKFFSTPGDLSLDLTGDVVTEDLAALLASVCWNDLEPILRLIRDREVNEYIRGAALEALVVLVSEGEMTREDLVAHLREQFVNHPREPEYFWSTLVCTALDIYPGELLHEIESAFEEGLVDSFVVRPADVQWQLSKGKEATLQTMKKRFYFVRDAIRQMEWWACFDKDPGGSMKTPPVQGSPRTAKVGRNDPCPCGSGKKYKKCCLH